MSTKEQHQGWRWDQLRYRCKTLVQATIDNIHDKDSSSSVQEWSWMTRCIKEDRNIQHRKGGPWPAQGSKVKMIGQRLSKKYSMKMRHTILLSHNTSDMIQMYWGCPLLSGISEIISEKSLMREKERKGERLPRVKKDEKSYKDLQPGRKTTILKVLCVSLAEDFGKDSRVFSLSYSRIPDGTDRLERFILASSMLRACEYSNQPQKMACMNICTKRPSAKIIWA